MGQSRKISQIVHLFELTLILWLWPWICLCLIGISKKRGSRITHQNSIALQIFTCNIEGGYRRAEKKDVKMVMVPKLGWAGPMENSGQQPSLSYNQPPDLFEFWRRRVSPFGRAERAGRWRCRSARATSPLAARSTPSTPRFARSTRCKTSNAKENQ